MQPSERLPEYENPPVIEVVCGIRFEPLDRMLTPHFGLLWERFRSEYPTCEDQPPLVPQGESGTTDQTIGLKLVDVPPLPRVWFVHSNGNSVIQIQRDGFLHNWRKAEPGDEYPRFKTVIAEFRDRLAVFESFLDSSGLGKLQPNQCELTYINHIPEGEAWSAGQNPGELFPDFSWRAEAGRFLPVPDGVHHRVSFSLPEKAGKLNASIRRARRMTDNHELLVLELGARGKPAQSDRDALWDWFALAHEWIVRGFGDLTNIRVQERVWKRKE